MEYLRLKRKKIIGYIALACSTLFVLIRAAIFLGVHSVIIGSLSLLPLVLGLVLGLFSRSTWPGRLALLGPLFLVGMLIYYILCWYRMLPYQ